MFDLIAYKIDSVEAAIQKRLDRANRAYENICETHRQKYLPAYDCYPHRNADGEPIYVSLTEEESKALIKIYPPLWLQILSPQLRQQPVFFFSQKTLETMAAKKKTGMHLGAKIKNYAGRFIAVQALKHGRRDASEFFQEENKRGTAYHNATHAWRYLTYCLPPQPYEIKVLEKALKDLQEIKSKPLAPYADVPIILLGEDAHARLMQTLNGNSETFTSRPFYDLSAAQQKLNATRFEVGQTINHLCKSIAPYEAMKKIDDPACIAEIKNLLSEDELGNQLLNTAEADGVIFELVRYKSGYKINPHDPVATYDPSSKTIQLVNVDNSNKAEMAISLGHELCHYWQFKEFNDFLKKNDTDIDRILRTRFFEADAWAKHISIAFILKEQGESVKWDIHDESFTGYFETVFKSAEERGLSENDALNYATSALFTILALPGSILDVYERQDAFAFDRLNTTGNIALLVAQSPLISDDFLCKLTSWPNGGSYLHPQHLAKIQAEMHAIGRSPHATAIERIQPRSINL